VMEKIRGAKVSMIFQEPHDQLESCIPRRRTD